jgi:V/A-type H+-transporting ATPase subunit D
VDRGATLLRRKREALVAELFRVARPAIDARTAIAEEMARACPALLEALAVHGHAGLRALAWPDRRLTVEIRPAQVWGVAVSDITDHPPVPRSLEARGVPPAGVGPATVEAADRFETLADLLIEAAPRELLVRRLGDALARTSRQVHTLEQRVGPRLEGEITRVRRTLDQREREEQLRLKHVQRKRGGRLPSLGHFETSR